MSYRIAINGYGRIGRCVLRALYETLHCEGLQVVAINEPADLETIAHLTKYDSTHGRFAGVVKMLPQGLLINGDEIRVTHQSTLDDLPWKELEIDLVLECSGVFSDRAAAQQHLDRGAKRVLFSQPAEADVDATIVYGINHEQIKASDRIISNASCTTNCIIPVIQSLGDVIGIESGHITTIHSAMNDQPVIDAYHHTDLRRTRSASNSIIPVETGLAKGIARILPRYENKFTATAIRVPTVNVSIMDITMLMSRDTSVDEVNGVLQEAANGPLLGILGFTDELLASCDFNHDPRSSIVDGGQTGITDGRLVKVMAWFDNEWGYANRMLDVACQLKNL
ncbi:MAG: type I glyceraldehyde-3-phosphate dehydrogenase [Pseudomonadales bacterium]